MSTKSRRFDAGDSVELTTLLDKSSDDTRTVNTDITESQDSLTTFIYGTWDAAVVGVCWLLYGLHHDTSVDLWFSILIVLAETWQWLSFAFFKRVDFQWNNSWSYWLSNALSWSSNFLGQSTSGYFAAIAWVAMIILLAIFAVYGQRKLRWVWPMKLFSLWLMSGVSFMYLPVAGAHFRMLFGCLQGNVTHWDYPQLTCWSGTHIGYACISGVLLPFFIFCSCVVAATCFEMNPNQREDAGDKVSASARAHARGELLNVVLRTALLFCFVTFAGFNYNHWPLALSIVFSGAVLTFYQITYMPYYNITLQVTVVFQALVVFWSGICVVITNIRGAGDHGAIYLLYFCLPLMILIAILAVKARMDQVLYWGNEKLTRPHLVELKARLVMRDGMHKTNLDEAWVDHTDSYSTHIKSQLWKQVEAIFQLGVARFPEDPLLHLAFAGFYLFYSHNKPLAYRELSSAQSIEHGFDVKFILFLYHTRAELETTWGHTSDVQSYIEFKERKTVADNSSRIAARSMFDFWTELLRTSPNVTRLIRLGNTGRQATSQAQVNFERLLQINATSVPVLRAYGGFIIDFHGDINTSSQLLHRADELEDARSNMVSTDLAGMSFLDQQKLTLDIFDERNAVAGMSVEKDTFAQIISLNGSCRRMFGYALNSELLHRNISIIIPEPIQTMHDDIIAEFLSRNTTSILNTTRVVLALHKNGTIFPINLFIRWADTSASKVIGVMSKLQTDDEQVMFDKENNSVVTYCTQNTYSWYGFNREMLVAREIYLGGLIPNFAIERAITGKDKRRREMLINRAAQKCGVLVPCKHHTSNKLTLIRVWTTSVLVRGCEVSFIRMSKNVTPDNLTGEENALNFSEEELSGGGILSSTVEEYFKGLSDVRAKNYDDARDSDSDYSDSDSDSDSVDAKPKKSVKIGAVQEQEYDYRSDSDDSHSEQEKLLKNYNESGSDNEGELFTSNDRKYSQNEDFNTQSRSILKNTKNVNNLNTTALQQANMDDRKSENTGRSRAQQRLETSAALTMAYTKGGFGYNKHDGAESDRESHVAESYAGSENSNLSGAGSMSSSLWGNEGGGHVSGHRLITAFIHDENEQLTLRLSRVSKFSLLICFIIFGCWLAMYLVTDVAMSAMATQFSLLTLAGHRRYISFRMADIARTIDLSDFVPSITPVEAAAVHLKLGELVELFEGIEQVLYDDSRLSQSAKDFLYVPSIQVKTLVGSTFSTRTFNLREVGQSFLANAFRLTSITDLTGVTAETSAPMYYLIENVPGPITQAYTRSLEDFQHAIEDIYTDVWSIQIVTYTIALLVVIAFIFFIFRPTVGVVEKSKADVLRLFLVLPRPVVRLLQRRFLTALRNQGDDEEDDEEGNLSRERAADFADDVSEAESSMSGVSGESGNEEITGIKQKDIDEMAAKPGEVKSITQISTTRQASLTSMHNRTIRILAAKYAFLVIYVIVYTVVSVVMAYQAFNVASDYTRSIVGASNRQIFLDQAAYFLREHTVMPRLNPNPTPYIRPDASFFAPLNNMDTGFDTGFDTDFNTDFNTDFAIASVGGADSMMATLGVDMLPVNMIDMEGNNATSKAYYSIERTQAFTRALLYGNSEMNIVAATDTSQTNLLYSNICSIFAAEHAMYTDYLATVHANSDLAHFNGHCETYRSGINVRGMQEPIVVAIMLGFQTATTDTAGRLAFKYPQNRYDFIANEPRNNLTYVYNYTNTAEKVLYDNLYKNIQDIRELVHSHLDIMQTMSLNDYRDNAIRVNNEYDTFRKIFLICFVIFLFVFHLIIFHPIFSSINDTARQAIALLLIIPPDVVSKVPHIHRFVKDASKKNN